MSACRDTQKGYSENVANPVDEWLTGAKEKCTEARRWVEREVRKPIEKWRTKEERKCKKKKCKWWCACCNKWFCWIVTTLVKIVEWVIEVVGEWVVEVVCKTVVEVVRIVAGVVLDVVGWAVGFVVCLFTDPLEALKSFGDLWFTLVDAVDDVLDLVVDLLDDVVDLLEIVEDFIVDLIGDIPVIGTFVAAIAKWILDLAQGVVRVVRDLVDFVQDLVVGILSLDPCRLAEAVANLGGAIGRAISVVGRVLGGFPGTGFELFGREDVEQIIENGIVNNFGSEDQREQARDNIQLGSRRFGLPIKVDQRRMCISSREPRVSLKELHEAGTINLYQAAGRMSGCKHGWFDTARMEVVYKGTNKTVSLSDIRAYLNDGSEAAPEFEVYAITKKVYERYYKLAQKKAKMIGLTFEDGPIENFRVITPDEVTVDQNNQSRLFGRLGRTPGDRLCEPPAIAVFGYEGSFNGFTTWYRPPADANEPAGVTFRDRQPAYVFRWVLIHELGHYFGLNHAGHDGLHMIMYTGNASAGLDPVTGETIPELIFFTGEPRFTIGDASETWEWLFTNARDCILGD
jgi:hypothetical protein